MEYIVINYLFDKGETISEGICFTSQSKVTGLYTSSVIYCFWNVLRDTVIKMHDSYRTINHIRGSIKK